MALSQALQALMYAACLTLLSFPFLSTFVPLPAEAVSPRLAFLEFFTL
jgi:hypothetical protein